MERNIEEIPREIALDYLKNEAGVYAVDHQCIYTNDGVWDVPYEEILYYEHRGLQSDVFIVILYDEKNQDAQSLCKAASTNVWNNAFTNEEFQEAVDKIVTALVSLGVKKMEK